MGTDERVRDDAPITAAKDIQPARELSAEAVTIAVPARKLYDFWRRLENLPRFMDNLEAIEVLDDARSRWTVKGPAGRSVSWESIIIEDRPGESISWRSAEGSEIANSGRVEFRDAGARGTVVRATIAYDAPGGFVGKLAAKVFQREPRFQSRRDLRRLKQLMETGEIATGARNAREHSKRDGDER